MWGSVLYIGELGHDSHKNGRVFDIFINIGFAPFITHYFYGEFREDKILKSL